MNIFLKEKSWHLNNLRSRDKTVTVLGVMVFGGLYVENVESRRRTRYAVLSGVAIKNYFPDDAGRIRKRA